MDTWASIRPLRSPTTTADRPTCLTSATRCPGWCRSVTCANRPTARCSRKCAASFVLSRRVCLLDQLVGWPLGILSWYAVWSIFGQPAFLMPALFLRLALRRVPVWSFLGQDEALQALL